LFKLNQKLSINRPELPKGVILKQSLCEHSLNFTFAF
jgi:hypothetical protein